MKDEHTCYGDICYNPRCDKTAQAYAGAIGSITAVEEELSRLLDDLKSEDGENIPAWKLEDVLRVAVANLRRLFRRHAMVRRYDDQEEVDRALGYEIYICPCGHTFAVDLGKYGCPNCEAEVGPATLEGEGTDGLYDYRKDLAAGDTDEGDGGMVL